MKLIVTLFLILGLQTSWAMTKEQRKKLFSESIQRLKDSKIEEKAPKLNEKFPEVELNGKKLSAWLENGPVLFTVYRGGWCPYCVKQLKEYESNIKKFESKKIQIFAISPEKENEVAKTKKKNKLSFALLSDKNHKILRTLNLVFKVEDAVEKEYQGFGINLAENQGNTANELPIPATYLIGKDGKILYAFVDADYAKRASTAEILKAVE